MAPMTPFLIFLHVISAILLLGPVTVSVSTYQAQMLKAAQGDKSALGASRVLHKITNSYGYISALVPILGIGVFLSDLDTYASMGQFHASILLAVIAWVILFAIIIPRQKKAQTALESGAQHDFNDSKKKLSMFSGIFCLLWLITAILMFT